MSTARAILLTLRPRQWVKNLFVLAPLVFAKQLFELPSLLAAFAAALAFCALSGAVYAFNDVRDVELDRRHPIKRSRPIAAGHLGERAGLATAGILATGSLVACALIAPALALVAALYLAVNLTYSLYLKRVAFLDVLLIASGFLLRVVGGALAIDVVVSPWLLACTALLASLLGFGKRAHELAQCRATGDEVTTRVALAGYREPTLRWILVVLAAVTGVCYGFYTVDARTVEFFGTSQLLWTTPFCVAGIYRFLQLAAWRPREDSPTEAILRDPLFLLNMAAWGAAVLAIIYR
jgi:decaprenyl-phosphate phosphoribosyltransferase